MIKLTKFNRHEIVINSDLIESIETTPDTVLTLVNGEKLVVVESVDAVVEAVIAFKRKILSGLETINHTAATVAFRPHLLDKDEG